jgi:hypothetical protein
MIRVGFEISSVDAQHLRIMLDALVRLNLLELKQKRYPNIYKAGVVYRREPRGGPNRFERWQTISDIIENGYGDCEDLASARVAQLRMMGVRAVPWLTRRRGGNTWHVVVRYPNGRIEDPSKILGMGRRE